MLSDAEFSAESSADAQVLTSRLMGMGMNVDRVPMNLGVKVYAQGEVDEEDFITLIEEVMARRIGGGQRRARLLIQSIGFRPTPRDRAGDVATDLEDLGFEVDQSDRRKKDVSVKAKRGPARGVEVQEVIDVLRRRPENPGRGRRIEKGESDG